MACKLNRGLTLAEIVLTLGIMATLSLIVIGLFSRLLMTSKKSSQATTANLLAESILDKSVRAGPPGWGIGGDFSVNGGKASLYTTEEKRKTDYVYQVTPVRVLSDDKMGELYEVTVLVSWWTDEANSESVNKNLGKLSKELSRTVYVRGRFGP